MRLSIVLRAGLVVAFGSLICGQATALEGASATADRCAPHLFRWDDFCKPDPAHPDRAPWRSIALDANGELWLTLGGDYRVRVEFPDKADYGLRGGEEFTSLSQRLYLHADLHAPGGARLFAQLAAANEDGRKPGPRPVDETSLDASQLFLDAPIGPVTVRRGRQEANFDGNRLVGLRDAAIRRTFDGVRVDLPVGDATATAFYCRPVGICPDAFDDQSSRAEDFFGLLLKTPPKNGVTLQAAFFDRRRDRASFASASGREDRKTWGLRATWRNARYDVAAQAAYQSGDIGVQSISAGGATIDAGVQLKVAWAPRLGLSAGYASGDRNSSDGQLNTFDPLYPNLSSFTEAPIYYPSNQLNVGLNATVKPNTALTLHFDALYLARAERTDAIYASSGRVLVAAPVGSKSSAVEIEATARWTFSPSVDLYGAIVRSSPLGALDRAGGGVSDYALIQLTTHF